MQLTPAQIEALFAFTRKKYVHWYDLQAELADHLASRIEEACEQDALLNFETALGIVYKEFGLFGFAHIVQQKDAQLRRSSRRLWWTTFKAYFGLPHVLAVLGAAVLAWQVAHALPAWLAVVLLSVPYLVAEIQLWRIRRQQRKAVRPLLLLELSPLRFTAGFFFVQVFASIGNWTPHAVFAVGLLSLLCLLVNRAAITAHRRVQREAEALYPEAFPVAG